VKPRSPGASVVAMSIGHVVDLAICVTIVMFTTVILADGKSLLTLRDSAPVVTNPAVVTDRNRTLVNLLGKQYGMGMHHDSQGRSWSHMDNDVGALQALETINGIPATLLELDNLAARRAFSNPATALDCNDLRGDGLGMMTFTFLANFVAICMIFVHALALAGTLPAGLAKKIAMGAYALVTVSLFIVMCLVGAFYGRTFSCANSFVPSFTPSDSFDLTYAIGFVVFCMFLAIGAIGVSAAMLTEESPAADSNKLKHAGMLSLAATIVIFVTAALADGRSVFTLKENPPPITSPALSPPRSNLLPFPLTLRSLAGDHYSIGLHHDSSGRSWSQLDDTFGTLQDILDANTPGSIYVGTVTADALAAMMTAVAADAFKHPVTFLSCFDLRGIALSAMSFAYLSDLIAFFMMLFHALALAGSVPPNIAKFAGVGVWSFLTFMFLMAVGMTSFTYNKLWECEQAVIPSFKPSDHFEISWGFAFAVLSFIFSIIAVALSVSLPVDGVAMKTVTKPAASSAPMNVGAVDNVA